MITLKLKNKKQKTEGRAITSVLAFLPVFLLMQLPLQAQPAASSDPVVLIAEPGQLLMNAMWSPDGKTIAYSAANFNGIWLADATGNNKRQLTADEAVGFGFSWSPDGTQILGRAATYQNRRRFHQVKLYDVNNLTEEVLVDNTRDLDGLPSFTPDGSLVAMVLDRKLEVKSSDRLSKNTRAGSSAVVYAIDGRLINANLITRSDVDLTAFEGRFIFNVRISPNGQKVAFQVQGKGLYMLNTDGSGLTHLGFGEHASWLPDNKHIVVTMVEDDGHNITGGELYAIDVETTQSYHLTSHTNLTALKPAVSPCGKYVAFDNPDDGKIYVMQLK